MLILLDVTSRRRSLRLVDTLAGEAEVVGG